MKFADDVKWSEQEMELNSTEDGRKFLLFFLDWFTAVENTLNSTPDTELGWGDDSLMICREVNNALAELEIEKGHLGLEWLGQMLLLAREHWKYGDEMMDGLSAIEMRVVQIAEVLKLAELQEQAAQTS